MFLIQSEQIRNKQKHNNSSTLARPRLKKNSPTKMYNGVIPYHLDWLNLNRKPRLPILSKPRTTQPPQIQVHTDFPNLQFLSSSWAHFSWTSVQDQTQQPKRTFSSWVVFSTTSSFQKTSSRSKNTQENPEAAISLWTLQQSHFRLRNRWEEIWKQNWRNPL